MGVHIRQTDSADRLPPTNGVDAAPYELPRARPTLDWPTEAARWIGGMLAALLAYWLIGADVRAWLATTEGIVVKAVAGALVVGFFVKRLLLVRQPGGYQVSLRRTLALDASTVVLKRLDVEQTHAATPGRQLAQQTYSPTIQAPRESPREPVEEAEIIAEPELLPPPRPDQTMIEALRERGHIDRSGHSLLLGYTAEQKPAYIEMAETGFIAIAGHPRKGKSVTAALLVGQAALMGWELVICDKHGAKADGLLQRVAPLGDHISRAAIEPGDILKAIDYWHEIIANRLSQPQQEYRRLLLVIDEFTALILQETLPPAALHKLISAAVEAPKVGAHGLIIGHQWSERLLGRWGANLRRVITSRVVHRADPGDAAFLLPSAYANKAMTLPIGSAIYFGGGDAPAELTIPFVGARDLEWVAARAPRLTATQPTMPRVDGPLPGAIVYPAGVTSQNGRIAWLLRQGYSYRQIERELNVSHATISQVSKALQRSQGG